MTVNNYVSSVLSLESKENKQQEAGGGSPTDSGDFVKGMDQTSVIRMNGRIRDSEDHEEVYHDGDRLIRMKPAPDGGWGWWDEETSNPHTSAYVMLGLANAKAAGFTVDDAIITRGGDYLESQRTTIDTTTTTPDANEQVFIAYALAQNDQDVGDLDSLVSFREKLGVYAQALLALTLRFEQVL